MSNSEFKVFKVWENQVGSSFFYLFLQGDEEKWEFEERGLTFLGFDENKFPILKDYKMDPSFKRSGNLKIYEFVKE